MVLAYHLFDLFAVPKTNTRNSKQPYQNSMVLRILSDANAGVFEALLDNRDAVISDALNHASLIDGIRLCKAHRYRFAHGDMAELEEVLKKTQDSMRIKLIVTNGVFSMDGDVAKLNEICELADVYGAQILVDDCHATGFFGKSGRGSSEHCRVEGRIDIITSTLGKALGGATGGYITASKPIVDLLRQRASAPLPLLKFCSTSCSRCIYGSFENS